MAELLRLRHGEPPEHRFRFKLTTVRGQLPLGVDLEDKDALFDLLDGRQP